MTMTEKQHGPDPERLDRRGFFGLAGRRGLQVGLAGLTLPAFLAACSKAVQTGSPASPTPTPTKPADAEGRAIVGDVLDFKLTSDQWAGEFGYVDMKLWAGIVAGKAVYFIRTDASDEAYATKEKLVFVPKMAGLNKPELSGAAYFIAGGVADQPVVLNSEPGMKDFTPAFRVFDVAWKAQPKLLRSVQEVLAAEKAGQITVTPANTILNAPVVKWSTGQIAVDADLKEYLGGGQLIEQPDIAGGKVKFKLHQCFPGSRYIVTDHSLDMPAMMTKTGYSPRLQDVATAAGATGRVNIFLNGTKGSGPMGAQASVFDSTAGEVAWSPFWDHYAYEWAAGKQAKVLRTQTEIHAARDAGDLKEYPGVPDTKGKLFTVNCPVPVLAPNTV